MRRKSFAGMLCPIARSLNVVGEWWTLLIVRDALDGARRFEDFRATGIADNILSTRLELLVREGVFERRAYQEHPPRYEYLLTAKGRGLLPIITALGVWGLCWTDGPKAPPEAMTKRTSIEILAALHGEIALSGERHEDRADGARQPPPPATTGDQATSAT